MSKEKARTGNEAVEDKLFALYRLQTIDAKIDEIRRLRGELPLKVQDLEDEIEGLETRINNIKSEIEKLNEQINIKKNEIKESQALIKKYETQQMKVRNSREYDSITREIEYQQLEVQLSEKRIKEYQKKLEDRNLHLEEAIKTLEEKKAELEQSKSELDDIILDTQKDEEELLRKRQEIEQLIEERLLKAYNRIRSNARNGLAIVPVKRDACWGCFNKIPPQRQLDVASRRKIIVCEYCGRILVDENLTEQVAKEFED